MDKYFKQYVIQLFFIVSLNIVNLILFSTGLIFLNMGCIEIQSTKQDDPAAGSSSSATQKSPPVSPQENGNSDGNAQKYEIEEKKFSYEIQESTMWNQFRIVFSGVGEDEIVLREDKDRNVFSVEDKNDKNEFVDETVLADTRYTYKVGKKLDSKFKERSIVQVDVPFDISINGQQELNLDKLDKFKRVRNLYFHGQSELITNGLNLEIKAQKITSDGGSISTFKEGATASTGVKGRDGGQIKITADSAFGILNVNMRGEHGGGGFSSESINTDTTNRNAKGNPGHPGQDGGSSGRLILNFPNTLPNSMKVRDVHCPGAFGPGGNGGLGPTIHYCLKGRPDFPSECFDRRVPGDTGPSGKPGAKGDTCFFDFEKKSEICH